MNDIPIFINIRVVVENNESGIRILFGDRLVAADAFNQGFKIIFQRKNQIIAVFGQCFQSRRYITGCIDHFIINAQFFTDLFRTFNRRLVITVVILACRRTDNSYFQIRCGNRTRHRKHSDENQRHKHPQFFLHANLLIIK